MGKKILISGAGVAGPTLAWWLLRGGFEPTIVERAPSFRAGGHIIDFWGLGYEIAERMELIPTLRSRGYVYDRASFVRADGSRASGFGAEVFKRALGEKFMSLQRGDLARAIFEQVEARAEVIFGEEINSLNETAEAVEVGFASGRRRDFDLVIGADGLHSAVRRIAFGATPERWLGYHVAVFESVGYPRRNEGAYLSYAAPGRQISRFSLSRDRTGFLFVFAADARSPTHFGTVEEQKIALTRIFDRDPWIEWPEIRRRLMAAEDLYFDVASQIAIPAWSKGRIALVGDAAYCPSLLAGEGASFAMTGAYLLAGELAKAKGDHRHSFVGYEQRFRPFIEAKQKSARDFATSFTPRTPLGLFIRDLFLRATVIPAVGDMLVGKFVRDEFPLPDYPVQEGFQNRSGDRPPPKEWGVTSSRKSRTNRSVPASPTKD